MRKKPDCVMLAAGESVRMSGWKLLLPVRGETLIERSVNGALAACGKVFLVTGYRHGEIENLFDGEERVIPVCNPGYEEGMFSSIRAGASRVETERFFVALGDMPSVGKKVYEKLLSYGNVPAVIPKYGGKKGHPVLLSAAVREIILSLGPGHTLRDALARVETLAVPVDTGAVLVDIDDKKDYENLIG